MANRIRDWKREAFWRGVLARHSRSALSVRAFCRLEDVSEPSYYAWRRTLSERDAAKKRLQRRTSPRPAFLPAVILPPASGGGGTPRNGDGEPHAPWLRDPIQRGPIQHDLLPRELAQRDLVIELRGGRVLRLPATIAAARLAEIVAALEASAQEAREMEGGAREASGATPESRS